MPKHTVRSIIIHWCNVWSYRIGNFETYTFTIGNKWLEGNTSATNETVKLCKDRKTPSGGKECLGEKLNKIIGPL